MRALHAADCTRCQYLDVEDRRASPANPAAEATLSNELARKQITHMLVLHAVGVACSFTVLCLKLMWGGAAMLAPVFALNAWLWHYKARVLDQMLCTDAEVLVDHYDHLQSSKRVAAASAGTVGAADGSAAAAVAKFLPTFVSYKPDPARWTSMRQSVLDSVTTPVADKDDAPPAKNEPVA